MARAGKATAAASVTDGERGSTDLSMSPPVSTSPARTTKQPANTKKRKRGDDAKALKRSKLRPQHASPSPGDESDGGQDVNDNTQSTVKLEDEDEPMEEQVTTAASGPVLHPADAERILVILERYVLIILRANR